jgi:hypothetical protein
MRENKPMFVVTPINGLDCPLASKVSIGSVLSIESLLGLGVVRIAL